MSDVPFSLTDPTNAGPQTDPLGIGTLENDLGSLNPFGTPTNADTTPTSADPSTTPVATGNGVNIPDLIGTVEDVAHGFGFGPGSAATQAREAAAKAAAAQQQMLLIAVAFVVGGVVLYKLGVFGGGSSSAPTSVAPSAPAVSS